MHSRLTLLSVFATFIAITISQKCYGLDGTQLDDTYAPCNSSAKNSGCCATNRASGADICLDSGLCMSTDAKTIGMLWQNGCTDPTGKDVACPSICPGTTNNSTNLNPVPAWNIQQCDYGTYCCRAISDRRSCCDNATAPKITTPSIGALQPPSATTASVSATSQPTRIAAASTPTSSTLVSTNSCSKEKHQTAVVGGTIGGLFGAIIIGLAGALLWLYKQEKRQRKLKEHYEEQFSQTAAYRKTLASSAASLMATEMDDVHCKSSAAV